MRLRPTAAEERRIAARSELRMWNRSGLISDAELHRVTEWAHAGWRTNGVVARTILFVVAAVGVAAVGGFFEEIAHEGEIFAAVAGVAVALWLNLGRRFLHTGVEEGCFIAGGTAAILALPNTGAKEGILLFTLLFGVTGVQLVNSLFLTAATASLLFYVSEKFSDDTAAWLALAISVIALVPHLRRNVRPYLDRAAAYHVLLAPLVAYATYRSAGFDIVPGGSVTTLFAGRAVDAAFAAALLLFAGFSAWSGIARRSHPLLLSATVVLVLLGFDLSLLFEVSAEAKLLAGGVLLIALASIVSRLLRREPQGLTARQLRESKVGLAEIVGASIAAPVAHATPSAAGGPQVGEGQGSSFGGAGASGDY